VGHQSLSRYRFGHVLFQQYLYNGLSLGERRLLHGEIAALLEELYTGCTDEIAVQLARHYVEAGEGERAVDYLLQAGDQARDLYAHQEAIDHYQRALKILKERKEHERAARTLMKLGLTYHTAFDFRRARQAYEEGFTLWQQVGEAVPAVSPPPAPHALRMNVLEPITLDPILADDTRSENVIGQLFSGLVELTPDMNVVPGVARSWEVSDGGRRYLFHLRDDVRWSDGTPVTAGDFEYAWKRVLDPSTGSLNASLLYDVKRARPFHRGEAAREEVGVRALDKVTLMVELEGPTGYFLHLLASYPVPRLVVEAQGQAWTEVGNIVTNGPFRLEAWRRGESISLARNPKYHGRFGGNIERVELFFRRGGTSADLEMLEMYKADNLDVLDLQHLPLPGRDHARQQHARDYVTAPHLATYYVGFNVSRSPFDDHRVRRAFGFATDRETLADVVLRGYVAPGTGGFIPPGMPGHSARIGLSYDPEGARKLLAEAGYPKGRGFPLVDWLLARGSEPVAEYLQAQWRENLRVEIRRETLEYAALLNELDRDPPPMFHTGWIADYPDPDNFLRASLVRLQTRWRNEAYDRLVEEARQVMEQEERMKLYRQADRILVEEAAIMPLNYGRLHLLVKPWLTNFLMSAKPTQFWKDVIIEPH
jgi:oligopeptide transport system substrate-binding protein